ncbi:hypothetical protein FB565_007237 [Actinoplanes lutulentus]|uniref:M23 family metallopeptidase n=1 Tax=Actinoplanes lutulentus TaxID=1287878 RepID=UPI0015EBCF43|nr:M23 family metallopeptidase [Actinoplanes lutulentus]MBB2947466.1 hypothetical protein [Actinoplanes lutulentus]
MTTSRVPTWFVVASRLRGLGLAVGPGLIVGAFLLNLVADPPPALIVGLTFGGAVPLALGLAAAYWPGVPRIEPIEVGSPVRGRWVAINSPASKKPSHGTNGYGQTFAIDLIHEPEPGGRPVFGEGDGFRSPGGYPGFGQPVYAPSEGTVVRVHDSARDHRSRNSWAAYFYLIAEGMVREFGGPKLLLGNHVILDTGDGIHAVLAHLKIGSISVKVGQEVTAGQEIGQCGNSGNSSEPHLHFQLMDSPRPMFAAGLPFHMKNEQMKDDTPATGEARIFH